MMLNEWMNPKSKRKKFHERIELKFFISLSRFLFYLYKYKDDTGVWERITYFFPWKHNQRRRSNEWMNEKMTTSSRITRKNEWANDNDMQTWTPFERKEMRNGWWRKKIDRNKGNLKIYMVCVYVMKMSMFFSKKKTESRMCVSDSRYVCGWTQCSPYFNQCVIYHKSDKFFWKHLVFFNRILFNKLFEHVQYYFLCCPKWWWWNVQKNSFFSKKHLQLIMDSESIHNWIQKGKENLVIYGTLP